MIYQQRDNNYNIYTLTDTFDLQTPVSIINHCVASKIENNNNLYYVCPNFANYYNKYLSL